MTVSLSWRAARFLPALLILNACPSSDRPTAPRNGPEFAISDAAHEGGTPGFYFLPPMVAQPAFSGTFDGDLATLNPRIAICDVSNGPDSNCGASGGTSAIIIFTTSSTPAITLDPTAPQYQVLWDTKGAGFVAGGTYRVHITAGAAGSRRELGFADVLLTSTPGQVKHMGTGDLIALKDGRTLAVDFRIETRIPGSLTASGATPSVTTGGSDLITATVEDLHGALLVSATVVWSVSTTPATGVADASQPLTPTSGQTGAAGTTATTFKAGTSAGIATVTALTAGLSARVSVSVAPTSLTFSSVTAGLNHSCGLTTAGQAYCWGSNTRGQLGDGSTTTGSSPVAVSGGAVFASLTAGAEYTCGVTLGGQAYCWGRQNNGVLGDGTDPTDPNPQPGNRPSPVPVLGGLSFASLSAPVSAGGGYTCGLTTGAAAYCWGAVPSEGGQASALPQAVPGVLVAIAVSSGHEHTCWVITGGAIDCWGRNYYGEIGDGTSGEGNPDLHIGVAAVVGGLTFATVSAGLERTCGITTNGLAYCWGYNGDGLLGVGPPLPMPTNADVPDPSTPSPRPVLGGLTFATLSTGQDFVCGVTTAGAAYCWGSNYAGQLGNGNVIAQPDPVLVSGGLTFSAVSAGAAHACGVTTSGSAYCWGTSGLGNGSTEFSVVPVKVAGQP